MKSTEVFVVVGCDLKVDEIFLAKEDACKDADARNIPFLKHNIEPYRVLTLHDAIIEIEDLILESYVGEDY